MCVLAQPRSFRGCQGPFLHLRALFMPRSHLRPTSGRARTPKTFSKSPVTFSGRDSALGTKSLSKQRAAPQPGAVRADHAPRGALGGSFPHPALNSSNPSPLEPPRCGLHPEASDSLLDRWKLRTGGFVPERGSQPLGDPPLGKLVGGSGLAPEY